MNSKFLVSPQECRSTHGGAGYAPGSYWDNGAMVCGWCGTRIEQPHPTGEDAKYTHYGSSVRISKVKEK